MRGLLLPAAITAAIILGMAIYASGQDRMPPIPADKMTAEQKRAVEEFIKARNAQPTGPFIPMLRSPEVMIRARAMGDYLRYKTVLPPRLSEFVILITARQWTQQYEWNAHYQIAIDAGLKTDIAKAIAEGRRPEGMTEDEQTLYDFCSELEHNRTISDATYARMVARFGEAGVVDTAGIVGYYSLLAIMLNTARTPAGKAPAPVLPSFPR